jgi:hypothetical protein
MSRTTMNCTTLRSASAHHLRRSVATIFRTLSLSSLQSMLAT